MPRRKHNSGDAHGRIATQNKGQYSVPLPPLSGVTKYDNISVDDARKIFEQAMDNAILQTYTWPTRPSSDGYYHIQVEDRTKKNGRRQIKAKTLEELKQKVLDSEHKVSCGLRKTFAQCFELAMERKLHYIKDTEKLISASNTVNITKAIYRRYLENTGFESKYVDEISKRDIEQVCDMALRRYDMTKKAFAGMKGIICAVMKYAYSEYLINDNPYDRVDFRMFEDMFKKPVSVSDRVHTDKEIERMLDYIHEHQNRKPYYIPAYALELQILMGLRRGEVAPLAWSDVYEDQYISISKEQLTDKNTRECHVVNHTKTYVNRRFPQTEEIREFLERYRAIQETYFPGSEYLFPSEDTKSGIINNNVVYKFYSRMCEKLGIEISREVMRGPHSFRRNGITRVTNNTGGDFVLASQMFGNSPETAKNHYYTGADMEKARIALEGSSVNKNTPSVNNGKQKTA